ncbi:MAG: Deaminated glutathione amidase [Myxococcota bacterium]|nr:Deaminated glutathione amidase [Myxococcota bacterium]
MELIAAAIQLTSTGDISANLAACMQQVETAADRGANFITLPENWSFLGDEQQKLHLAGEIDARSRDWLLSTAADFGVYLLGGGHAVPSGTPGKVFNQSLLASPGGQVLASYNKIHLFDVDLSTGQQFRESNTVMAGEDPITARIGDTVIGLTICYDLRFPELYRRLANAGAQVLCIPSAFTLHTGKDHWHALLRARAIENQCYVIAAAQYGRHNASRVSYGHALIVDPWGTVVAEASDGAGAAVAPLNLALVSSVRDQLPCLKHQRMNVL